MLWARGRAWCAPGAPFDCITVLHVSVTAINTIVNIE